MRVGQPSTMAIVMLPSLIKTFFICVLLSSFTWAQEAKGAGIRPPTEAARKYQSARTLRGVGLNHTIETVRNPVILSLYQDTKV